MNPFIIGSIVLIAIVGLLVVVFIVKRGKCVVPSGPNTCDDGKAWMCLSDDANPTCEPIDQVCGPTSCTTKQYKTIACMYDPSQKKYAWSCTGSPDIDHGGQYIKISGASSAKASNKTISYDSSDVIGKFVQGSPDDAIRACSNDPSCKSFEYGYNFSGITTDSYDYSNPNLYKSDGYQLLKTNNFNTSFRLLDNSPERRVDNKPYIIKYVPVPSSTDTILDGIRINSDSTTGDDKNTCFSACDSDTKCTYASFYNSGSQNVCIKGTDFTPTLNNEFGPDSTAYMLIKKSS